MKNDLITIVRDPKNTLGKHFKADGSKSAQVWLSLGIAEQRSVPDAEAMARLLREIGSDPHAAIINSSFPSIPVGEQFLILSEAKFRTMLNISDRPKMVGIHTHKYQGKDYKVMGRFKENTRPSAWQLLDRDIDHYTPPQFAKLTHQEWLKQLEKLIPGLAGAAKVTTPSSSSRVLRRGKPVSTGNAHTWIQLDNGDDIGRMRLVLQARAIELDMAWVKPRESRNEPGKIVGKGIALIVDQSVWSVGRLVFDGQPTTEGALKVKPLVPSVSPGGRLDTSVIPTPERNSVALNAQKLGVNLKWRTDAGGGLVSEADDLTMTTELELQDGSIKTVEEAVKDLQDGQKLRCQTPFRDSQSCAAFLARGSAGKPFLHDSGTNTTHWLSDSESDYHGFSRFDDHALTLDEIKELLGTKPNDVIEAEYPDLVVKISTDDQERFYDWINARIPTKKTLFHKVLREAGKRRKTRALTKAVGDRQIIVFREEDITQMADEVEQVIQTHANVDEFMTFGGALTRLHEAPLPYTHQIDAVDKEPPKVQTLRFMNSVDIRGIVEKYVVFQNMTTQGAQNKGVPAQVIETLFKGSKHRAPLVRGLLPHPIVVSKTVVISKPGLDTRTGLYYVGDPIDDLRPYTRKEANAARQRISSLLFGEFVFRTPADGDAAVAMLLTGILRRILPMAPGFALLAHVQSSGKTTLARMIHVVLTGRDMPVATFVEGNEEEVEKRLIAMLLSSPSMVVLDNITDGFTFQSAIFARALTMPTFTGRILGESREVEVPTNTLFVLTGNNLNMAADETTRWLPVWLDTKTARPQERIFQHSNVIAYVLSIRDQVIRDVIGIIHGFLCSKHSNMTKTRFSDWDLMVRQPLIWAGGADMADIFQNNAASSSNTEAQAALLTNLLAKFAARRFMSSHLTAEIPSGIWQDDWSSSVAEALGRLKAKDARSPASVGRVLAALTGRLVETSVGTLVLRSSSVDGTRWYWVENLTNGGSKKH